MLIKLRTGDGRMLPRHLKAQISRELDRLELVVEQLKEIEDELQDAIVAADAATMVPRMLIGLKSPSGDFMRDYRAFGA